MAMSKKMTGPKLVAEDRKATRTEAMKEELRALTTDDGKLQIFGLEASAAALRERARTIKDLLDKQKKGLETLVSRVAKRRKTAERQGSFHKTCTVSVGSGAADVQVIWADKYSVLPVKSEPLLRKAFGKDYGEYFHKAAGVKPRKGKKFTIASLKEHFGDEGYAKLCELFDVSEDLHISGAFMDHRFRTRAEVTAETNEYLDVIQDGAQSKPSVKNL